MLAPVDTIISIDPATSWGWAAFTVEDGETTLVDSGALKTSGEWGSRFEAAREHLVELLRVHSVGSTWLAYEDIQARTLKSWANLRVIAGLTGCIYQAAHVVGIPESRIGPIPLVTAKVVATGNGKASKDEMVAAFTDRWGRVPTCDDEADAAWVGQTLADILTGRRPPPNSAAWKKLLAPPKAPKTRRRKAA